MDRRDFEIDFCPSVQVVKNGQTYQGRDGLQVLKGLGGAKGLDVNEHLVAVAGSLDDAVIIFERHSNGSVSFMDRWYAGIRHIPSFHHVFNPLPIPSLFPSFKTALSESSSTSGFDDKGTPTESMNRVFALQPGASPVRLRTASAKGLVSANDALNLAVNGTLHLLVAESDPQGAGSVVVYQLKVIWPRKKQLSCSCSCVRLEETSY
jgi:hypothetical protein